MSGRVLHTGQVIVDIAVMVEAVPEPGGDVFGEYAGMHVGGGYNVLYAIRRTEVEALYAGTMGAGPFAEVAEKGLAAIGVEHVGTTAESDIGFCVAVTDATAERTFISTRGAETHQPLDAFDHLDLRTDDVLYISGYSLLHEDNRRALVRLAQRLGAGTCRTVLDVSPVVDVIPLETLEAMQQLAPLWSVNEREAAILLRRLELGGEGLDSEAAARRLADRLGRVLVRVGPGGAWFADGGSVTHVPTIEVTAIDTNGAGDAHCGILCAGMARGDDMLTALRRANVAGALSTTVIGPASCPTEAEIDAALGV